MNKPESLEGIQKTRQAEVAIVAHFVWPIENEDLSLLNVLKSVPEADLMVTEVGPSLHLWVGKELTVKVRESVAGSHSSSIRLLKKYMPGVDLVRGPAPSPAYVRRAGRTRSLSSGSSRSKADRTLGAF